MDAASAERAARLRRIAAVEIAAHRESEGFLGAALDGSLATGAVWPTSDLDFTIVPQAEFPHEWDVEWGQREGIPWHKHLTSRKLLLDVVEGYPQSFIRRAEGEFDLDANWLLDGLAAMEVVEDPDGLLAETKQFVAARRFAPEVWEGRRAGLLEELRRTRDAAHETFERGDPEEAYSLLLSYRGFGAVAGQLWLEAARRIYSNKEQDGLLAEVTRAAGQPEAHALYRAVHAADPARAEAAAPLIRELGARAAAFYEAAGRLPLGDERRQRNSAVWAAWVRHLAGSLSLAPRRGHPAHVYQRMGVFHYWTARSARGDLTEFIEKGVPGAGTLAAPVAEIERRMSEVRETLLGDVAAEERARSSLAAADRLHELTQRFI